MSYWKNEYDKAIINKDYERAIPIKDRHIPTPMYKYRSFDENEYWKDWVRGFIVHTSPMNFNDPYDCLLSCSDDMPDGFNSKIIQEKHLVACFSKIKIKDSLLMWSHYTNNHSGFCIEYDFSKLSTSWNLFPMVYDNRREFVTKEIVDNENIFFNPIILKCPAWKYEQEWRLIVLNEEPLVKRDATNMMKTIYFGLKTSDKNKARIQEIAPKHVSFKEIKMRNDSYELYAE